MTFDAAPGYLSADDCRPADLIDVVSRKTDLADYPYASTIEQNVLIYDGARLRKQLSRPACRPLVETELARALLDGPGIVVLAGAFDDPWVIDRATWQFEAIIAAQRAAGGATGDHFAAGQNDRIWNALEKLALRAPEDMHRDYHLGFAAGEQVARFPVHAHRLSTMLTLQGAVAHTDMPVETGPTMYLPHSQKYLPGYLAWRMPEFGEYFAASYVQLPLCKGDAVFFNPALFHAAGANRTADVSRMANLLQVSSALGRAMEAVDRAAMSAAVSPALQGMVDDGASPTAIANVIAACAEGYPYPVNLDLDQPVDGLAPRTQADILGRAVSEQWSRQQLETELDTWSARRQTRRYTYSTKEIR